jgi:hypothetical protein
VVRGTASSCAPRWHAAGANGVVGSTASNVRACGTPQSPASNGASNVALPSRGKSAGNVGRDGRATSNGSALIGTASTVCRANGDGTKLERTKAIRAKRGALRCTGGPSAWRRGGAARAESIASKTALSVSAAPVHRRISVDMARAFARTGPRTLFPHASHFASVPNKRPFMQGTALPISSVTLYRASALDSLRYTRAYRSGDTVYERNWPRSATRSGCDGSSTAAHSLSGHAR